jgi:hypothetical protein
MAAFKTDNGLISLTKVAPEMTAVSDYTGDVWHRAALFGDPGGQRSRLYDYGLTLDAQLTQVYQGVVSGGSAKGNGGKGSTTACSKPTSHSTRPRRVCGRVGCSF